MRLGKYLSSINYYGLSGDKCCLVACKKQRGIGDVFDGPKTALRNCGSHPFEVVSAGSLDTFGSNISRKHGVYGNVPGCKLDGCGSNEAKLARLTCSVVAPSRV